MNYGHWDLMIEDFNITEYFGFIYLIVNKINNRRYIGKKNFIVKGEPHGSWKDYTGSQLNLNSDIKELGKENFDFIILEVSTTKENLNIREKELQKLNDVIRLKDNTGKKIYYNKSVSNRKFDSSGVKRRDWLKDPATPPTYKFRNLYTGEVLEVSHIELAEKLSIDSKRIFGLIRGKAKSVKDWVLFESNTDNIRRRIRTVENIESKEKFTGTTQEIISYIGTTLYCFKDLCYGRQKSTRGWKLIK